MSTESNCWIFQGNPEIWRVLAGVQSFDDIRWVVKQHKDRIRVRDRVFIWESGPDAGVVAAATVTAPPVLMEDVPAEKTLYPKGPPPAFQGRQMRVVLKIERVIEPRIRKATLKGHRVLKDLLIIRNPRGTNFTVSPEQAGELEALVAAR